MTFEKRLLLIVNPVAGRKGIQKMIPQIIRIFMDAGYLMTTMVTSEKDEGKDSARKYGSEYDLIVAAGGLLAIFGVFGVPGILGGRRLPGGPDLHGRRVILQLLRIFRDAGKAGRRRIRAAGDRDPVPDHQGAVL